MESKFKKINTRIGSAQSGHSLDWGYSSEANRCISASQASISFSRFQRPTVCMRKTVSGRDFSTNDPSTSRLNNLDQFCEILGRRYCSECSSHVRKKRFSREASSMSVSSGFNSRRSANQSRRSMNGSPKSCPTFDLTNVTQMPEMDDSITLSDMSEVNRNQLPVQVKIHTNGPADPESKQESELDPLLSRIGSGNFRETARKLSSLSELFGKSQLVSELTFSQSTFENRSKRSSDSTKSKPNSVKRAQVGDQSEIHNSGWDKQKEEKQLCNVHFARIEEAEPLRKHYYVCKFPTEPLLCKRNNTESRWLDEAIYNENMWAVRLTKLSSPEVVTQVTC